jgi:3-deoxy-manno-octulosonate cytidylyltransferase (CMP-KDO synthetase)
VVAARAVEARVADTVVVASDDEGILDAVRDLPVDRHLTSQTHRSGTERIAEIIAKPEYAWADVIVNVQGDEPFFPREAVRGSVDAVHAGVPIATPAAPMTEDARDDENQVKVAVDARGRAVMFARTVPPNGTPAGAVEVRRHIGIYAYTPDALKQWVAAPPVPDEERERLEQLRPLQLGIAIGVVPLPMPAPPTVDTPEDLRNARYFMDSMSERVGR